MNPKLICLFAISLTASNCYSQDEVDAGVTDITKVTILNPGISFEKRIGRLQTLYAQGFINTSGSLNYSQAFGFTSNFYFDPAFTVQYRYYYNSIRRQARGRRTEMNSLNYVSAIFETVFSKRPVANSFYGENNRRAINTLGMVWGFQRNYKKRFSIDLNLGPGYLFSKNSFQNSSGAVVKENVSQSTIAGQLNVGFWLNKEK